MVSRSLSLWCWKSVLGVDHGAAASVFAFAAGEVEVPPGLGAAAELPVADAPECLFVGGHGVAGA